MKQHTILLNYCLQLGDNASILGHRLGEWCGHGPVLEQDIALTNMALDHIGQARSLYQYAAELFQTQTEEEKKALFSGVVNHTTITEDTFAFLRDAWDFKNVLLVEQLNKDWAYTVARSFYYDNFTFLLFTALLKSKNETLAAFAEKSLKEAHYHLKWSSEWVIRLGDGTEESHSKMQQALNDYWSFTGELFMPSEVDQLAFNEGLAPNIQDLYAAWFENVSKIIDKATLTTPPQNEWMQKGGKQGKHTEHLGFILTEMQYMQRVYPNLEW